MKWGTTVAGIIGIGINPGVGILQIFGMWAFLSIPGFRWPEGPVGTFLLYASLFSLIFVFMGGIYALLRRKWWRALIGSIIAVVFWFIYIWFIPGNPIAIFMEILATIAFCLIVISKRVFDGEQTDYGKETDVVSSLPVRIHKAMSISPFRIWNTYYDISRASC